jgi:hypothetical protein
MNAFRRSTVIPGALPSTTNKTRRGAVTQYTRHHHQQIRNHPVGVHTA